jgi:putative ABC transport system permease protein
MGRAAAGRVMSPWASLSDQEDALDTLRADLSQAFRALRGSRAFTGVATLTLALGIGASVALFSVVDAVLLRPLPYPDAERLMVTGLSLPDFDDLVVRSRAFEDAAVWASNVYDVSFGADAESLLGAVVSPRFFPLLGQPSLGRPFRPGEDGEPLAVISHGLWQRRFGGSADVLGRSIDLADRAHTIVGVMPPEFEYPGRGFEVWSALGSAMRRTPEQGQNRSLRIFRAVLKRKPGLTAGAAQAEVAAIAADLAREHPETNTGIEIELTPLSERLLGDVRAALLALLGAAGLVLLIACANVAHLALARTSARGREIAVRRALGASDPRLARQFLAESLVLALVGTAAGVVLATWAVEALRRLEPAGLPRVSQVRIDGTVLLFALAASIGTAVLVGVAPTLAAARVRLVTALGDGARSTPVSGRRFRQALVVGELALSLVVIAGAGLLARSFHRLVTVDPGFEQENLVAMNVGLWRYENAVRRTAVLDAVLERLRALPGVEAAGSGTGLPPETAQRATSFEVRERPDPVDGGRRAYFLAVTPDYFRALGTRVVEGRPIEPRDSEYAAKVVVMNRSLAHRLFGEESALGKHVRLLNPDQSSDWREVVGVVADVRYSGLDDPGEAAIYTPFAQTPFIFSYPMVRTRFSPQGAVESIRQALRQVDPRLAAARIAPMSELVAGSVAQPRFNLLLLSSFAALALVLSAVGTYGVIAYGVVQRTREIGVRLALGARPGQVVTAVVRQGLGLAALGVTLGLGCAWASTRLLAGLLFGVTPTDPLTLAAGAALLAGVAVGASYLPARRAARIDPVIALRAE